MLRDDLVSGSGEAALFGTLTFHRWMIGGLCRLTGVEGGERTANSQRYGVKEGRRELAGRGTSLQESRLPPRAEVIAVAPS